jgi:hypothetical protein
LKNKNLFNLIKKTQLTMKYHILSLISSIGVACAKDYRSQSKC